MKPENTAFLEANRPVHTMLVKAGIVQHIDYATKEGLLRVIHEEFDGGYLMNFSCGVCVINMIKYVYGQYDQWLSSQSKI